jgi:hypothetical protein
MRKYVEVKIFLAILILVAGGGVLVAQSADEAPSVKQILDLAIARLPSDRVEVSGYLTVRKLRGVMVKELGYEMIAEWGATPSKVSYVIKDVFGGILERMEMTRDSPGVAKFEYKSGDSETNSPIPDMSAGIQGSDMSWTDLTLSFLWWTNGVVSGREDIRGRSCFVMDVQAPEGEKGQYSKVRLWIDDKLFMLMQAEGYDAKKGKIRTLWVKSFKKVDERWMLKDMEIQSYPSVHRTKLSVDDFKFASSASLED